MDDPDMRTDKNRIAAADDMRKLSKHSTICLILLILYKRDTLGMENGISLIKIAGLGRSFCFS